MKKQIAAALAASFVMSTAVVMAAPVTDLVNKTTFGGDLRVRYDIKDVDGSPDDTITKYRLRLNIANKFSDNVTFAARLTNGENQFGENDGRFYFDQYNMTYKIPDYTFKVGRQDAKVFEGLVVNTTKGAGTSDALYTNKQYAMFEGMMATTKFSNVNTTAFFGQMSNRRDNTLTEPTNKFDVQGLVLSTKVDAVNLGLALFEAGDDNGANFDTGFYSLAANTSVDKMYYGLEYAGGVADDEDKAWMTTIAYGSLKNVGDVRYAFEYKDVEANALVKNLTDSAKGKEYKFWSIKATKQLSKDVTGELFFEDYDYETGNDENTIRGEILVKF